MRNSPSNNVKKLWALVDRATLDAGNYQIQVLNNWNAGQFGSQKFIVLSQVNAFGGKNNTLGSAFIAVGAISMLGVILFGFRKFIRSKGILYSHLSILRRPVVSEF